MSTTSTKSNMTTQTYRKRLGLQEQRIVQVAENFTPAVSANWSTVPTTQDAALNTLAAENSGAVMKTVKATYDFATNGGAVGTIDLGVSIPDDSIIVEVYSAVLTPTTSGGAGTIKLVLPVDGDLTSTIAVAGSSAYVNAGSAPLSTEKRTTAARSLSVTIATAALTAGKIEYFVRYLKSV